MNHTLIPETTIIAPATSEGESAIAVVRLSGADSIRIVNELFRGKDLSKVDSHTLHFGRLQQQDMLIDEVLVSIFLNPHSYTGEDAVEISCHGSSYIVQQIIQACISLGAQAASPGEFTRRAFLNGKLDLSQAEAVADVIHAQSEAAHRTALHQLRGGFSKEINAFRERLIHFAALIELELDFSEEDVAFADRKEFVNLLEELKEKIHSLLDSFKLGQVIRNGVPVVIAGKPNAGKSTLFNALLKEERAIVSDIAGTTRDTLDEVLHIGGIQFRFTDTAGLRDARDTIEKIGIDRTLQKIQQSALLLYVYDAHAENASEVEKSLSHLQTDHTHLMILANHCDRLLEFERKKIPEHHIQLSAKTGEGIAALKDRIVKVYSVDARTQSQTIVTNARHVDALGRVLQSLNEVVHGLADNRPGDLLSIDIRMALSALGEITGAVEVDKDILGTIFGKFCIGK
ncbi:MAG: tRNA uridine-5-carboxymethylaminomethyl(34) synthesis GTPase MnmE [Chitinophagaceae bacterium]|nr:tRNA uridine-5-carboxymethylaminomethyl(34) synthesis GTPase MnmE [Chitinophagaceae bacterium]